MKVETKTARITGTVDDDGEVFGFLVEAVNGALSVRILHDYNPFSLTSEDDGWMMTHPSNGEPAYMIRQERLLALEDEVIDMLWRDPFFEVLGFKVVERGR